MSLSSDINSFEDVKNILDMILETDAGAKFTLATRGAATHWRQRACRFRVLYRKANPALLVDGKSPYDALVFDVRGPSIYVKKTEIVPLKLEPLDAGP